MPVVQPDHGASSKGYLVESDNVFPYPIQFAAGLIERSKHRMPTYQAAREHIRTRPCAVQRPVRGRRSVTLQPRSAFNVG
jgi:hypothetical protein